MDRTRQHVAFLDSLRAIAILAVFAFHSLDVAFGGDQLPWGVWFRDFSLSKEFLFLLPTTFGWAGVAIFFAVSGFCIHLSYLRGTPGDWRGFFQRRFFRIYPPYLLAVLLFSIFAPARLLGVQIGSHVLLLQNCNRSWFFGINPAFWSIAVEAQLYLLYPLLLRLVRAIGWQTALLLLGAFEVSLRGAAGTFSFITERDPSVLLTGSPFYFCYSWAIGAALADAFAAGRPLPFRSLSPAEWLTLAVATNFVRPLAQFSFLLFALATVSSIARRLGKPQPTPPPGLLIRHLRWLGICSYSFYLLHFPIMAALPRFLRALGIPSLPPFPLFFCCALSYPLIAACSWIFYRYVEVPSIAWGKLLSVKSRLTAVRAS